MLIIFVFFNAHTVGFNKKIVSTIDGNLNDNQVKSKD
jgi:hypothetical protein